MYLFRRPDFPSVRPRTLLLALSLLITVAIPQVEAAGQGTLEPNDRRRGYRMLDALRDELRNRYYDSTFHGLDLDSLHQLVRGRIERADNYSEMLAAIASFMLALDDSHTLFDPPTLRYQAEYGIDWLPVGEDCYITDVKEGSDAETQGIRPGDRLVRINGRPANRRTATVLSYLYYLLRPSTGLLLELERDGRIVRTQIRSEITELPAQIDLRDPTTRIRVREQWMGDPPTHITVEVGRDVLVWRMPEFVYDDRHLDGIMGRARRFPWLILDMRGNPGGAVAPLMRLLGRFFGERTVVGFRRRRGREEPIEVRPRRGAAYAGQIVILLDAYSASAAEIAARALQLAGKAVVVGDQSAGQVMESVYREHRVGGATRAIMYGARISINEIVMSDGGRLEGVGVTPDHPVLPTPTDLASGWDPQMAFALRLAGIEVTAKQAATIYDER